MRIVVVVPTTLDVVIRIVVGVVAGIGVIVGEVVGAQGLEATSHVKVDVDTGELLGP